MSKLVFDFDKYRFVKVEDENKEAKVLVSFSMALNREIKIIDEDGKYYMEGVEKIPIEFMMLTRINWTCLYGEAIKKQLKHYDKLSDGQLYDVVTIPDIYNEIGFTYVFSNSHDAKTFINSMMDFASSLVMIGATKEENDIECY